MCLNSRKRSIRRLGSVHVDVSWKEDGEIFVGILGGVDSLRRVDDVPVVKELRYDWVNVMAVNSL
jgi:hypothetical protein